MNTRTLKPLLGCVVIAATLQGCGGGGGGGSNSGASNSSSGSSSLPSGAPVAPSNVPGTPTVNFTADLKKLHFNWSPVANATFYRVLENSDGASGFHQIGADLTADQTTYTLDIGVHNLPWASTSYQIQACNAEECATSATIPAAGKMLEAIGYVKASNTDAGDTYGWTLALSGDGSTLAVGAPGEDSAATGVAGNQSSNSVSDSGAVYIYTHDNTGKWTQQTYLKASNPLANANFGEALALSDNGNTLAIGAPFESGSAARSGAVYVFTRNTTSWSQQAYVKAANAYSNAYFGWSLALNADGTTLAVGATGDSSNATGIGGNGSNHTATNAGAAYVFSYNGTSWSQQAYVKASNTEAEDNFGAAVRLSGTGDRLAVGAPYESSAATGINGTQTNNTATNAGAVYVFNRNNTSWSQQAYVKASNTGAQDNFGAALAFDSSGATLAVGAPYESSASGNPATNSLVDAGAAYVFTYDGSWHQEAMVKASNADANDDFGSALALSSDGNTLAVGAIGESSAAAGVGGNQADNSAEGVGAAYLFHRAATNWTPQTYLKPSTASVGVEFGSALGISNDSGTLAISGGFERGAATGIGGNQADLSKADAGAAWLF